MKIIAIVGPSGSGKSTLAHQLAEHFSGEAALISHDNYYHDASHLSMEARAVLNFDHPDALDTALLCQQLARLKQGDSIAIPTYDFTQHIRCSDTIRISPKPYIILDGIMLLADPGLRELIDYSVFLDIDIEVCFQRRLARDIYERGREPDDITRQYHTFTLPMYREITEPTKRYAHLILSDNQNAFEHVLSALSR
ncbi:MAG: hypothetical protein RLZZ602_433 [Pseudomonadota bacterium]|jgi:uridine kinase